MDLTLLHPKIVHLPIALAVLMPLLSFGLLAAWWSGALQRRTWIIATVFQAVLAVTSFAAVQTGEIDEEPVERVVPEAALETHEEAAEVFLWASFIVFGLFGLATVVPEKPAKFVAIAATAATLGQFWLGYRVGEAGGALVYEHNAASAFTSTTGQPKPLGVPKHDDDDD